MRPFFGNTKRISAQNKLIAPRTFWLDGSAVPVWEDSDGDRVRVAVGSFGGVSSPLIPAEPIDLLDVALRRAIRFELKGGHHALVYVREGGVGIRNDDRQETVAAGQAITFSESGGRVAFEGSAHMLILSGPEMNEAVVMDGPFIMNDQSQIEAARARYGAGEMGQLAPLAEA